MTDIVKQLNDISVANTYRLHDLLDKVLGIQFTVFPTSEIKFDQDRIVFVSEVDGYNCIVQRDMNTFTVVARVVKGNDIVAECVVSVVGEFNEKFGRMDSELKSKVVAWFDTIGEIDTAGLINGTEPEAEQNEAAEPAGEAMPEAVDAEIVSEGDGNTK